MNEPRIWALPEEPPVGTVVESVAANDPRRWRRSETRWALIRDDRGRQVEKPRPYWHWLDVLEGCLRYGGARECHDPDEASSAPAGDRQELDALRRKVQDLLIDADKIRASVRYWKAKYERTESRRCELMLQMREVSLWNARIVRALLGSFDEKGDRQAQAAAAEQKARDLVAQRAHPAVTP